MALLTIFIMHYSAVIYETHDTVQFQYTELNFLINYNNKLTIMIFYNVVYLCNLAQYTCNNKSFW